jgi:transcriptional regulator with XRE-family HTH domain
VPSLKLDNYLRTYRKRSGFSQDELAYLLGAPDGAKVSRYERTSREPNLETLLAYEAIFGVPPKQLFAGRTAKVERAVTRRARLLARRLSAGGPAGSSSHKLEMLAAIAGQSRAAAAVS